jgi:hypothetical protein
VAVSTNKEVDAHIPNYPSLPPQLICQLHNLTMHVWLVYLFFLSVSFWFIFPDFCVWHHVFITQLLVLIQADVETDEVYAQMTLQPLNAVWHTALSDNWFCNLDRYMHFQAFNHLCVCSKSKKRLTFQQSWELQVDSRQTTFARPWLLVTQALMGDSPCLAGRLKKCFLLW